MMPPRLLLASTEPPSVGGSSTASVQLWHRLRADGWDARYVSVVDQLDAAYFRTLFGGTLPAPDRERFAYVVAGTGSASAPTDLGTLMADWAPDLAVGFGFQATSLLKSAAPWCPTVFVTGTCRQAQDLVTSGRAPDAMTLRRGLADASIAPRLVNHAERRAVEACDLLVTHSPLTLEMFERFFPGSMGSLYPRVISFAEWIADRALVERHRARPFDDRDIDVLFIASDWKRVEKNYPLVRAIARRLADARVHIVGEVAGRLPHVTHHGFVSSGPALFDLLGRAKVIACPSLIDAAPGVLVEGAVMGCNVVASANCGNSEICHPDLLVGSCDEHGFSACIRRAMAQKYDDGLEALLGRRSYRELLALLGALTQPFDVEAAT